MKYETYDVNENVLKAARQIIDMGVLTKKSFDDCQHISS